MNNHQIRLCYIDPVSSSDFLPDLVHHFQCLKDEHCSIDVLSLRQGLPWDNLEYHSYEALVSADLVKAIYWAQEQGYDAVVIGCFYDLCLHEAREICAETIVVAPCQSALQTVSNLANNSAVIIGRDKWRHRIEGNIQAYGYQSFVGSVLSSQTSVEDYLQSPEQSKASLLTLGQHAIENKNAEAIVLGCSANLGMYQSLQDSLGVPVIDPALAALSCAKQQAQNKKLFGWCTSNKGSLEAPWQDDKSKSYFADAKSSIGVILSV